MAEPDTTTNQFITIALTFHLANKPLHQTTERSNIAEKQGHEGNCEIPSHTPGTNTQTNKQKKRKELQIKN